MIIDKKLLDSLSEKAKLSPRLRINYDMRTTVNDRSQRMFNALEPGTAFPIHRHMHTSETVVILRGAIREDFYNDEGEIISSYVISAKGDNVALQVPVGQWYTLTCLESGTVLFNAKDGMYELITPENTLII